MNDDDGVNELQALLAQAQQMEGYLARAQERLARAQADAAETELVSETGGGKVRIVRTGDGVFRAVRIDPSLGTDVELLEDLVLAALHDASSKYQDVQLRISNSVTDE